MEEQEDKQLARLYDYTKFHIGIYLSFAGGMVALLGTETVGWFVSTLVESNKDSLYIALGLMILAGMCGGIVASSTIECKTFHEFWNGLQGPRILWFLKFPGKYWAMLEHLFFWVSLLVLVYAIVFGFATVKVPRTTKAEPSTQIICCYTPSASASTCQNK